MSDSHQKLRKQIRAGRVLLGMDQSALAQAINMTLAKISRAEKGETKSVKILQDIQKEMEKLGVVFLPSGGVDISAGHIEIIEGRRCYVELLNRVMADSAVKELLIMFASDKASPPEVNERYRFIRKNGIKMRQLIEEGDTYIMGSLSEYRTVPTKYFTNIVTLVYGNCVAQVNGDETRIVIYNDARLAQRERQIFSYFWDQGELPEYTSADERF